MNVNVQMIDDAGEKKKHPAIAQILHTAKNGRMNEKPKRKENENNYFTLNFRHVN